MSIQALPRLLELAGKSLLKDKALAIAALEYLPSELFPPLFMVAFAGRYNKTLKVMVCAFPFAYLPLGGLMQTPHQVTLQAALSGLDVLLAQKVLPSLGGSWVSWKKPLGSQKVDGQRLDERLLMMAMKVLEVETRGDGREKEIEKSEAGREEGEEQLMSSHRRRKLKVLDLGNTCQNFWRVWSGARAHVSPPMGPVAKDGTSASGTGPRMNASPTTQRSSLHLCCKKLKIFTMPIQNIKKVLNMVQLDSILEVEVNCTWKLSTLGMFAPYLGQMSNVQRLVLSHIHATPSKEEKQHVARFTSQFLQLHHLQKLSMDSPSFLEGRLDEMLRCLKTPLETLSITNCQLTESDLAHLSQCPNVSQLKDLDLSGISLTYFSPELLQVLLEKVAATLQDLDLDLCGLTEAHLKAVLPALSRCHQLQTFSVRGNLLSGAIVGRLLRPTARLRHLRLELYPAPLESYDPQGALHLGRFAQLTKILRDLGLPRTIWLSTSPCPHYGSKIFCDSEPIMCPCHITIPALAGGLLESTLSLK
ncbi:hypothetical protein GH733_015815, partial [Mirounga leonina]